MRLVKVSGNPVAGQAPHADGVGGYVWRPALVKEINSTGLTAAQIDALFTSTPANGTVASDPTNALLLVRQSNKWVKTAALTVIN